MTSRTLCYLDTSACGDGLSIAEGGLKVTTNRNALDFNRAVHGDLPVRAGSFSYEFYFWSTSRGSLAELLSIGVSQPDAPLDEVVGGASGLSWGFLPADGAIFTGDAKVANADVQAERICCAVSMFLSPTFCSATFHVNRSAIYTAVLDNGKDWVPAISIGSPEAGDLSVACNFGQNRFDRSLGIDGWWTETRGFATIRLASVREAFMSAATDTPANEPYAPEIITERFLVKRAPKAWPHSGGGGGSVAAAAFATAEFDNSAGRYNALIDADVKDSLVIYETIDAPPGGAGTLTDATTMFTASLVRVEGKGSVAAFVLRDTLARLDKPLPCRIIPPFADPSSAGRIWPVSLGATRNVQPLLLDEPTLTYALGDAAMNNVPLVTDGGAQLDPVSDPPQVVPLNETGCMRLDTKPVMRLSADCSSVGEQYFIPGAEDVLNGDGAFEVWSGGEPAGWSKPTNPPFPATVVANGSIAQTSAYGPPSALRIISTVPLNPSGSSNYYYGYPLPLDTTPLLPGRSYRITLRVVSVTGTPDQYLNETFGVCLLTKLSNDARYWITPHRVPINTANAGDARYTFEYTVPGTETSPLGIYITCVSRTGNLTAPTAQSCIVVIDDLRVQLRGQYLNVPLDGITLTQAFREILVVRAGEPEGVFSSADTEAIDAATGILIGVRYVEPPNIVAALQEIADTFGGVVYTDAHNVIRVRLLTNPALATPVAKFDSSNIYPDSIRIGSDDAPGLTTDFGCGRNQVPFAPGDFVSDTGGVPPTQRESWQGTSQHRFSSAVRPSAEYSHAVGAPRFHMLADEVGPAAALVNGIVAMYAPPTVQSLLLPHRQVSGKRKSIEFRADWRADRYGFEPTIGLQELGYSDMVVVNLPDEDLLSVEVGVLEWEIDPIGNAVTIWGHYQ